MMKSWLRVAKGSHWSRGIAYLLACCALLNVSLSPALALLETDMTGNNGLVAPGATWGDHTVIDTANGAIIDWSNFNTSTTQSVTFNQYDALGGILSEASAVLNRITSASPTQFNGALTANGRVFIVNPAGILFGNNEVSPMPSINVTQLVASGLGMTDQAFQDAIADPANEMVFEGGSGRVENYGWISATDSIHLVGSRVVNRRVLQAPNGLIVLAGGDRVRIAQDGSNVFVELFADPGGVYPGGVTDAENRSSLSVGNGKIILAAADTFGRAVGHAGQISAPGGTVRFQAARVNDRGPINVHSAAYTHAAGGTVELIGADEVVVGEDKLGIPADINANGDDGPGGNIILQSGGEVRIETGTIPHIYGGSEDTIFSAKGNGSSGDGGHIKIIGNDISIAPGTMFDASAQNAASTPGALEIETPSITVANGPGAGALDTVYEEDIEALSTGGTGLILRATGPSSGVTVEDIADNQMTGGRGGIELHATGADGSVSFADSADSISTTRGNIAVSAGSGGINVGSLETGEASAVPGSITLTTTNGGDITAQNLAIRNGSGHAEITADASGDLTINGNVAVGRDAAIQDIPDNAEAEAIVNLSAGNHVILNGAVTANSHGANSEAEGTLTKSYIGIFGDTNSSGVGDVTINGNLVATAISATGGTSNATIEVQTPNNVIFGPGAAMPLADGDNGEVHVESYTSIREEINGDVAEIIISQALVEALPDFGSTHMGSTIMGNVLSNDSNPQGDPMTASLVTGPSHAASFTLNPDGSYSYTPEAGYVGDDTFTYTATAGGSTTSPILVTITMSNTLPLLNNDAATTFQDTRVLGNVLTNDSDADGDPLTSSLVSGPANADSFQLNSNGAFSYTPKKGFVGTDSFTYSASDPQTGAEPAQATVTITVSEQKTTAPPAAPGVDVRIEPEISGAPALVKWVALELGISEKLVDVWFANAVASAREIPPVDSYASFKKAAKVLQDPTGIHTSALSRVIAEFASSTAPPTEEQMASIAGAIAGAEDESIYAVAGEYVKSLEDYVTFLVGEMGFSQEDAIALVTEKYVSKLAEKENVGLAAYVAAELANVFTDTVD